MAHVLPVQQQHSILTLAKQGWSIRRIARELGVHRKTVLAYLQPPEPVSKCTTNSTPGFDPKCTISTPGKPGRKSNCLPHKDWILSQLEAGLTAQRIYQDLRSDFGFQGSYQTVKRFVRSLRRLEPDRVWRIEVQPGEEAQVDFGLGAPVLGEDGKRRRSWVFRIVLSYSRKAYSESVFHQNNETFIRCCENGLRHFGGVPKTLNLDNLKAAVLNFDWADPNLNPRFMDFARHYELAVLPCLPKTPEHKGKVENSVGYIKRNALANRTFESLKAQNDFLRQWESSIADVRIHGTTKRQVLRMFDEEKPHLQTLPSSLFPCYKMAQRSVHRDGFVEVERSYYSAPPERIGSQVWVKWDSREVRLLDDTFTQLVIHRRLEPGKFSESLGIGGGAGALQSNLDYWLRRAGELGPSCHQWSKGLVERRGFEAIRSLMGLVHLAENVTFKSLNQACATGTARGLHRLRDIRALLTTPNSQTQLNFTETHPLIRNLNEYELFIQTHHSA